MIREDENWYASSLVDVLTVFIILYYITQIPNKTWPCQQGCLHQKCTITNVKKKNTLQCPEINLSSNK